jgi:glycosyltransferase involved in cell wall biosynthesis
MALLECVDAALATPLDARLGGAYLEYPTPGCLAEGAALEVRGWVIGARSPAVAVELCHAERVIRRVPIDVRRPDVAAAYPAEPHALVSGFTTTLHMRPTEGHEVGLRAVLADHARVTVATIRLRTRWRGEDPAGSPLVSVIIPSYRQAHYLHEAIESALAQTYAHVEVIVVDDGSPDNTSEVAGRYPGVRCIRQENRGVSEARNLGIRRSTGSFLIFLDADDRLLPDAVRLALDCFAARPEVAFVSGRFRSIAADGGLLYERLGHHIRGEHYAEMLRWNYVPTPSTVMIRRSVFESVAGFSSAFSVCADYDLYLRVLREFPAWSHPEEVAEYRRHGLGLSMRTEQMLHEAIAALRVQRPHVDGDPHLLRAYRSGLRFWKRLAGDLIARQIRADWHDGRYRSLLRGVWRLRQCGWAGVAPLVRRGHPYPTVER